MEQIRAVAIFALFSFWTSMALANGYAGHIESLDSALQTKIQESLAEKGFSPGKVDGKFGPKSRSALERFMNANGLAEEYGQYGTLLTPALAKALLDIDLASGTDGIELNNDEQMEVIRALGLIPSKDYWTDLGIILPD